MRTMRVQRLEQEPNRRRFDRGLGRLGLRAQAGLVVPLAFRGQTHGVLVAVDRLDGGPEFTAEDERLLDAFAASAATAIATAIAADAERRSQRLAATEQERARWARELHDETLQGLAALRLGLSSALRTGAPERLADAVRTAVDQLQSEITGLRSLITELRPAALDQLGVEAAIEALVDRMRTAGVEVDCNVSFAPGRLAPDLETGIYRIVQEALNNARTHGEATRAVVEVLEGDSTVAVSVRDNGAGFDPAAPVHGFGLAGMRERVELLEGVFAVESAPGAGTVVTARFPAHRVSARVVAGT
jgi:signal transduction histidine kinase